MTENSFNSRQDENQRADAEAGGGRNRGHVVRLTEDGVHFRTATIADPVPLGRQILAAAGLRNVEEHSLFAILPNGEFEDVRLDEAYDLRGRGAESFAHFATDRSFNFTIDNRQMEWGKPIISGRAVRALSGVGPQFAIYLEVRGGHDVPVEEATLVDLSRAGIERFVTIIRETTEGRAPLPSDDRKFLEDNDLRHEIVVEGGVTGVILGDFALPDAKFDVAEADLLILLPAGYPDAHVDMFYVFPWIRLKDTQRYPNAADQPVTFGGRTWQRWSRHANWRPGIDGIRTMVARARLAFAEAR